MLKNIKTFAAIIMVMLSLLGCTTVEKPSSSENEISAKQPVIDISQQVKQPTEDLEQFNLDQRYTLEKKLLPPKFVITNFEIAYDDSKKEVSYLVDYLIDLDIYESLTKGKQEMYFSLEYPEDIHKLYETPFSQLVKSEEPANNKMNYQVTITQKTASDISTQQIKQITNNLEKYNLHIADKDKDTIAIFDDIIGFLDYEPGVSKSEHVDDTE
ncbi:hypothetical protein D3H55_09920 [Bacillus salacetis]|uniref:Lipoprotein n=1 Tax=Bacillus salacetis TaxID=2315464 RepID=A0A3A1QZF0_9BACI|nr:hypothetical protein [Bacillus salacetis]RIW34289.1 hypothetical protein D3H55_09920 [Bacillus salacetis]